MWLTALKGETSTAALQTANNNNSLALITVYVGVTLYS